MSKGRQTSCLLSKQTSKFRSYLHEYYLNEYPLKILHLNKDAPHLIIKSSIFFGIKGQVFNFNINLSFGVWIKMMIFKGSDISQILRVYKIHYI